MCSIPKKTKSKLSKKGNNKTNISSSSETQAANSIHGVYNYERWASVCVINASSSLEK